MDPSEFDYRNVYTLPPTPFVNGHSTKLNGIHGTQSGDTSLGEVQTPPGSPRTRNRWQSNLALARERTSGGNSGRNSPVHRPPVGVSSEKPDAGDGSKKMPTKLNNYVTVTGTVDTLHHSASEKTFCAADKCLGSVMLPPPRRPPGTCRPVDEKIQQAVEFFEQYYKSMHKLNSLEHLLRIKEMKGSIESIGIYYHTHRELEFGAKLAWRNAPRCIGRIQWNKLEVFDARDAQTPKDMYDAIIRHLDYATNGGNIRSAITIFPQRTDGKSDFRVWNSLLIRYAGYKQADGSIIGDPAGVELTEVAVKLGWCGAGGRFDVLPLILQAYGGAPEVFDIPEEHAAQVRITHPDYPWFAALGLQWYAVPAVSNMLFDCGGMEYTAVPFSGWYMGTEIGSRNLCDPQRYNIVQEVAVNMGLDTHSNQTLWKDRAAVEVNIAVLHSYKEAGVTISDHHTAADSFMQHFANETKVRGGCPADWVWITPPLNSNMTPVFHQEMLNYFLKPSYEYQDMAWRSYNFSQGGEWRKQTASWKAIVIGLRFTSSMMTQVRRRRQKALVLYATETGKSQGFANQLAAILNYALDSRVKCMDDYDVCDLKNETLVYFVASTFGDGDPPDNGRAFSRQLSSMAKGVEQQNMKGLLDKNHLLDNIRFSVFALGSRAYPHFCNFGKDIARCMLKLKATQLNDLMEGDELGGQDEAFKEWAGGVYKTAIKTFEISTAPRLEEITGDMRSSDANWTAAKFRLITREMQSLDICHALGTVHQRTVKLLYVKSCEQLQSDQSERRTILVKLAPSNEMVRYEAGDHVGLFPANREDLVEAILGRVAKDGAEDSVVSLEMNYAVEDQSVADWDEVKKLPPMTLREALTHFLDLTTPPTPRFLRQLATLATDDGDRSRLNLLAQDTKAYGVWRSEHWPHLVDILEDFPSLELPASFLMSQLPILQPRFYSISSAPCLHSNEIHATIAIVEYKTQDGKGRQHHGVCSSWLEGLSSGAAVPYYIRTAPLFKLPRDPTTPVIMVGPGSGIAPLRSFWQERYCQKQQGFETGRMTLYFGCRNPDHDDIYREEIQSMQSIGVLTQVFTAYSRMKSQPKVYVQQLMRQNGDAIFTQLMEDDGHFYLCGDVRMAADVKSELINIIKSLGETSEEEARECLQIVREEGRFHEDIYGVVYRP